MSAASASQAQQSDKQSSLVPQPLGSPEGDRLKRIRSIIRAAHAIGKTLGDNHYAIIGGAACTLLGSPRITDDVDIVVPAGKIPAARSLLRAETELFDVDKRTRHTWFKGSSLVEIEILSPPGLFQEDFDATTPTTTINGTKVLKPALLLNAKCNSILQRGEKKRASDSWDIFFLLKWCIENDCIPTQEEVPNISVDFVLWFNEVFGEEFPDIVECWKKVGFDIASSTQVK
jgi:hypothetical protein